MTVISGGGEGEVGIVAVLSSRRSVLRKSVPVKYYVCNIGSIQLLRLMNIRQFSGIRVMIRS